MSEDEAEADLRLRSAVYLLQHALGLITSEEAAGLIGGHRPLACLADLHPRLAARALTLEELGA